MEYYLTFNGMPTKASMLPIIQLAATFLRGVSIKLFISQSTSIYRALQALQLHIV